MSKTKLKRPDMLEVKDKDYYVTQFDKKWSNCLTAAIEGIKVDLENSEIEENVVTLFATYIFDETANAEEVVGFYVKFHKDNALKDWKRNIDSVKLKEQDEIVGFILKSIYESD